MIIEIPFASYNTRRYMKPWGAKLSWGENLKPDYKFTARFDFKSNILEFGANEGDVIAFGQKDTRGNGTTYSQFRYVNADGTLSELTESQARKAWKAFRNIQE